MDMSGNQRGMALLLTLSVVTLLVAGGLELNRRTRVSVESAAAARDRLVLSEMATAGVHLAMAMLIKDKGDTVIDSIQEDWARPEKVAEAVAGMPFDAGGLTVDIRDELGKIQVNALVNFPEGRDFNLPQKIMWDRFLPLAIDALRTRLEETGGEPLSEETEPTAIVNSLKDWLDSGDDGATTGLTGAESEYYMGLDPPYAPNDGPFVHIGELLRVKGIVPELFHGIGGTGGIADFTTVHGMTRANRRVERRNFTFEGKININTADLPVLIALMPSENHEYAASVLEYRNETEDGEFIHDLSSPTWYKNALDIPGDLVIDPNLIVLSSDIFRIVSTAERDGVRRTIEAVVVREQAESGKWTCNVLNWQENRS
jgi:general secretion pathway protein K